jgi:hypothetical protein
VNNSDKPAFPLHPAIQCDGPPTDWHGMTLRDYFAGQALVALPNIGCGADLDVADTALAAYQIADAMLEVRSKP